MIELQSTTIYLRDIEDGEIKENKKYEVELRAGQFIPEEYEEYDRELRAGWFIPASISTLLLELFDYSVVGQTVISYRIVPTHTLYYTNYMPSHTNYFSLSTIS